jgi:alcohol dehydrogenase class IV
MSETNALPSANWNYPTSVWSGSGRIAEMPRACAKLGIKKPLLVTDPGLAGLPMVRDLLQRNSKEGLPTGLFSDIRGNPVGQNVADGVAAYHQGGHDGVIAFGGGSALDAGKAVAFMSGQKRLLWDFEDVGDYWTRADVNGIAPIVAVPTTAGTGSETGRAAVILHETEQTKKIIFHPKMLPGVAILDAELTVGLPASLTAATGMDALAHNLEAYCAPGFHPMADGIALEGTRLIREWLPVAVREGKNLVARGHMLAAAAMGSTAFQKGLGGVHSLSHPVNALYNVHHGLSNAVLMPYVFAFNRPAIEARIGRLCAYLGLVDPSFDGFMNWLLELRKELQIPHTLAELGVPESDLPKLAPMALHDPSTGGNPVKLELADMELLYRHSLRGDLPSR